MRNVIIYRHQLFKVSETFIFQQTKHLSEYHPIFAGRYIEDHLPDTNIELRLIRSTGYLNMVHHVLLRNNRLLYQALLPDHASLIHAHFGVEGVYALPLAKKLNIPLVTTFHGFDATCSRKRLLLSRKISWLNYLIHRRQLRQEGNLFICVSNFIKSRLLQLGFPENKLITHYIGVDTETIRPTTAKKTQNIILHVARLVESKGTEFLLRAFAILRQKGLQAELVIIGDGPLRQKLSALSKSLGIEKNVLFLGMQPSDQVIAWMQKSTVFCLPSITTIDAAEGLGLVLLEASACQIPIVATQTGGIPEAVIHGETGYLVAEKNPYALAEHLVYLIENDSACKKMGAAARQYVEKHFDLKQQTRKLEKIYSTLL